MTGRAVAIPPLGHATCVDSAIPKKGPVESTENKQRTDSCTGCIDGPGMTGACKAKGLRATGESAAAK